MGCRESSAGLVESNGMRPLSLETFKFRDMRSDRPSPGHADRYVVQKMRKFSAILNEENCNAVKAEHLQSNAKGYPGFTDGELGDMAPGRINNELVGAARFAPSSASRNEFLLQLDPPTAAARPSRSTSQRSVAAHQHDDHKRLTRELELAMAAMDEQLNKERHQQSATLERPRARERGFARDVAMSFTATSVGGTLILFALMSPPLSLFVRPVTAMSPAVERPAIQGTGQVAAGDAIAPQIQVERRAIPNDGGARLSEPVQSPTVQDSTGGDPSRSRLGTVNGDTTPEMMSAVLKPGTTGAVEIAAPQPELHTDPLKNAAHKAVLARAQSSILALTPKGWTADVVVPRPLAESLAREAKLLAAFTEDTALRGGSAVSASTMSRRVSSLQQNSTMQFLGAPADVIVDLIDTDRVKSGDALDDALAARERVTPVAAEPIQPPPVKRRMVASPRKSQPVVATPTLSPSAASPTAGGALAWRESVFSLDRN